MGSQKPQEYGRSFRAVAAFDQAVELNSIILRGKCRLAQPCIDIRQRLQRFGIGRRLVQYSLILRYRFAEFIFLQAASRPLEMFVDVLGHGIACSSGLTGLLGKSGRELRRNKFTAPDFFFAA